MININYVCIVKALEKRLRGYVHGSNHLSEAPTSKCGLSLIQALLAHNAKVYIAARSQGKVEEAIKDLKEETGKEGIFLKLDLSDLKAVKAAAEEFHRCVYFKTVFFPFLTFIFLK